MTLLSALGEIVLNPIAALRGFYLGASALIIFLNFFEPLRDRFLSYGSRLEKPTNRENGSKTPTSETPTVFTSLLDQLASFRVPHSYFTSFYYTSVLFSILWAQQLFTQGPLFRFLASHTPPSPNSMTVPQVLLLWLLMLCQGSRRLWESHIFATQSKSAMWCAHWVLGLLFYLTMSISLWIEGVPALLASTSTKGATNDWILNLAPTNIMRLLPPPNLRIILFIPIFLFASGIQHDIHQHFYELKTHGGPVKSASAFTTTRSDITQSKSQSTSEEQEEKETNQPARIVEKSAATKPTPQGYTLPTHPTFAYTVTPHYLCECVIYLSLMVLAAPEGKVVNRTVFTAFVFVAVNLGVTAQGTREWWEKAFGKDFVKGRWCMIPRVW